MTKCAAEQGTIVRGGSGSNYGDNKTQPLSYHFLSGASHFQPATAVGAVARWWRRMHGCCRGRRRARPGARLQLSSPRCLLCFTTELGSAQFSGLVTRHHRHHSQHSQQQPVVSAAATSSTIFQLESRPNLYHCVNSVINQPRSEHRLTVGDNVPL